MLNNIYRLNNICSQLGTMLSQQHCGILFSISYVILREQGLIMLVKYINMTATVK